MERLNGPCFLSQVIAFSAVVMLTLPVPLNAQTPKKAEPAQESTTRKPAVRPLTKEQLDKLLAVRLDGGLSFRFNQFANMFLVKSRLSLPYGVGLMTSSKEIAKAELQPVFPEFYRPTVREFLDAIALETSSEWKYDPSNKYFESDVKGDTITDVAIFEFAPTKREKPFKIALSKGWKAIDKGHWVMHVPPSFPVGMDIYELGSYSPQGKEKQDELMKKVVAAVSLEWAKRITQKEKVDEKEFTTAKVGSFDATFFETTVPFVNDQKLHWRQWVFSVDNKCYFVVSTIVPQLEKRIYPDVEAMLKSLEIKKSHPEEAKK